MMMTSSQRMMLRTNGILLGRILLGFIFFYSGVGILLGGVGTTAGYFESMGIPMAALAAWLVVALKLGAGGALMVGYRTGAAAGLLIVFTLLATLIGHVGDGFSSMNMNLWKNLAIVGGLLYAMAYGPGEGWSLKK